LLTFAHSAFHLVCRSSREEKTGAFHRRATMHARAQLSEEIENVELSITVTMPLKEWRALNAQLPKAWPAWNVGALITDALSKVTKLADQYVSGERLLV
jgi:hypothetical protein